MGVDYGGAFIGYCWFFSKKDLEEILNHVFNNLIVCGKDFDKNPEFHKKKIIKDLNYVNIFSFKNFGFGIFLKCEERNSYEGKEFINKECMRIEILIIEISPFLFLTKREKIDFNNFLKFFKIFKKRDRPKLNELRYSGFIEFIFKEVMKPIFEYKNNDFLLNLDDDISRAEYGYNIAKTSIELHEDFFEMTLYFKSNEKELEKLFQNFFKDFEILSVYDFGTFEKIRIPKIFLKSSMRINFKFNKLPMYVEFYKYDKEEGFKNLETYFQIEFGFLFERDIREANEDRKKLFNKHFKKFKKLSNDIRFRQRYDCEDYFKKTLFDENGFRIGGFEKKLTLKLRRLQKLKLFLNIKIKKIRGVYYR